MLQHMWAYAIKVTPTNYTVMEDRRVVFLSILSTLRLEAFGSLDLMPTPMTYIYIHITIFPLVKSVLLVCCEINIILILNRSRV